MSSLNIFSVVAKRCVKKKNWLFVMCVYVSWSNLCSCFVYFPNLCSYLIWVVLSGLPFKQLRKHIGGLLKMSFVQSHDLCFLFVCLFGLCAYT